MLQLKHGSIDYSRQVHVTNLTPPGSECSPRRPYDNKHQLMISSTSTVHVTNLTPPGVNNPYREALLEDAVQHGQVRDQALADVLSKLGENVERRFLQRFTARGDALEQKREQLRPLPLVEDTRK
jgi:hypothetical protein